MDDSELVPLPDVHGISTRVVRILAKNPGKTTLQGTNTYLIGTKAPYILVDTSEGLPAYSTLLQRTLLDLIASERGSQLISDIVISHWHPDHADGLVGVLSMVQKLHNSVGYGRRFEPPRIHKFPTPHVALPSGLQSPSTLFPGTGLYCPKRDILATSWFWPLSRNQALTFPGTTLRVIHTPGHTFDSISLLIEEDEALYTGDTIPGQKMPIIQDFSQYVTSLFLMINEAYVFDTLYPGHGPIVEEGGRDVIRRTIIYRMKQEEQVVELVKQGACTTWDVVRTHYATYPTELWLPAARVFRLILEKLQKEGLVQHLAGDGPEAMWMWVEELEGAYEYYGI